MKRNKRNYPPITWSESKQLFRCVLPADENREKRRDVYGKTQDEVMDKVDRIEDEERKGISSDMTLNEYSERWSKLKLPGLAPKTQEAYKNALTNHILPELGGMALGKIKPLHVDELLAGMAGYSSSLCNKVLGTMNQMMESAVENDLINKNPCRNKRAGGIQAAKKIPLTTEQQKELLASANGTRAELFVLLCLYAGLRREEALGLLWGNVHLGDTPYIDVRHAVRFDEIGRPLHSDKLKSKAASRSIPIPPILSDALAAAKRTSMFVVPSARSGGVMSLNSFVCMWARITNLSFRAHPHLLRHTYITALCAAGMDIKKIQYLAGHETVQMTLDIYSHVVDNSPDKLLSGVIMAFTAGKVAGNKKEDVKQG